MFVSCRVGEVLACRLTGTLAQEVEVPGVLHEVVVADR
jgi:hypothetical protein